MKRGTWFGLLVAVFAFCGCDQLQGAKDAASNARDDREALCSLVEVWGGHLHELAPARAACKAGADLDAVLLELGGCGAAP